MEARKNLSVFAILLFLVLFITSGKMLLLPYAVLFISAHEAAKRWWRMLMPNVRNHCMEVAAKKMNATVDAWPSTVPALMDIASFSKSQMTLVSVVTIANSCS
ncbi:hypothetical protein D5086_026883 [Populus alba]|uniref:Uncharacterized protein n=4 Tax=Populus TaxID=3689 RepID=A0ACC4B4P7_POPAL|nr:hypothetical protein NC653_033639 [Populus alba x Populus x berolinensis]TKS18449.1 hypothetical protein D5086_0000001180 [Populus alba]